MYKENATTVTVTCTVNGKFSVVKVKHLSLQNTFMSFNCTQAVIMTLKIQAVTLVENMHCTVS